ncbi:MAG: hypothetical protein RI900_1474, partial [Actinomycetota bacterium]
MKRHLLAAVAAGAVLFAACGDDSSTSDTTTAATAAPTTPTAADAKACAEGKTLEAGSLTIATGDPAFPPYVVDDKPESGQG